MVGFIVFMCVVALFVCIGITATAYISGSVDGDWNRRLNVPRTQLGQVFYELAFDLAIEKKKQREQRQIAEAARVRTYEDKLRKKGKL